jgi:raffinose/stachyose/melibiose transport system substrate-binding protein
MSVRPTRRLPLALAAGVAVAALTLAGCTSSPADEGKVELTFYMGAGVPDDVATAEALAAAFTAANPDITVTVDASGPEGVELDNAIKTKLSTDDMADLFWYNSGALMQALNPDQTLLNVGGEAWVENLNDAYRTTVSTDNGTYGAPVGSAMGGGMFYNIAVYDELGLEVPLTWDDFVSNNEAIRAAGIDPVIQSYGDTWTSQMMILADFYNVYANNPDFGTELTANEVSFGGDKYASASFEHLQELADAGSFNADFASTTLDQALAKLAIGEGAQYPMLTFAQATITQNYPDQADQIGFFAIPGESADSNGLTTWMPSSVYAPATTPHPEAVKAFLAFVASPAGCDTITEARGVTGPYVVNGCEISGDLSRIVSDMLPYFESNSTAPALEFLSPVKGPNLQSITVEVGSGIRDAASAIALYDDDNALQAQQLGLAGW